MARKIPRCRKHNLHYVYDETRVGGYNGAFSPLIRGTYHFYKCPKGCIMADSADDEIRTEVGE